MLLLLPVLMITGCGNRLKEPVTFYYVNTGYDLDMSPAIGSEQRETSGHSGDLDYLMALYLMGPASDELKSPIPKGISILSTEHSNAGITLELSDTSRTMTDVQFTLACSCLTLTCFEITDAEFVTINSGDRSITLKADELLLQDLITADTEENS